MSIQKYFTIYFHSNEIELSAKTKQLAAEHNFEVKGYAISAKLEELRKPRIVRVINPHFYIYYSYIIFHFS